MNLIQESNLKPQWCMLREWRPSIHLVSLTVLGHQSNSDPADSLASEGLELNSADGVGGGIFHDKERHAACGALVDV